MKEFMLLIFNQGEHTDRMNADEHQKFLKACESYIGDLKKNKKLIAAQPLLREGKIIFRSEGAWKEIPFNKNQENQVGYYHILAQDLDEAVAIAKDNPEFKFTQTARIEVRPIKTKETTTEFVYPKNL